MNHFEAKLLHFADESPDLKRFLDRQVEVIVDKIGQQIAGRPAHGKPARILNVGTPSPTLLMGLSQLGHAVYAEAGQIPFDQLPRTVATRLRQAVTWLEPAQHTGDPLPHPVPYDIVIAANNTLADCLTEAALHQTLHKQANQLAPGGLLLANVRNDDLLLQARTRVDGLQTFATTRGHCIYFATLEWTGQACAYTANRYLIAHTNGSVTVDHASTPHRAWRFAEINMALLHAGFIDIQRKPLDDDRVLLLAHTTQP